MALDTKEISLDFYWEEHFIQCVQWYAHAIQQEENKKLQKKFYSQTLENEGNDKKD